jgi:hypothetical protein
VEKEATVFVTSWTAESSTNSVFVSNIKEVPEAGLKRYLLVS